MLSLATLGSLHLTGDSGPLLAGRRKVLAVLAYLARRSPNAVPRAELTALFWPDRDEVHARQSLRQVIAELRPLLETLQTAPDAITLTDGELLLDAAAFQDAVRDERWHDAAAIWTGDFLVGTESLGGPAWSAWLDVERTALRADAARVFEHLLTQAESASDAAAALDAVARWCEVAPLDERAWTQRIDALVRMGRPVDAASCYETFLRRARSAGEEASPQFLRLRDRFAASGASRRRPITARALTLSALTQLTLESRTLLEALAVIGEPADATLLAAVSELGPHSFRAAVETLVSSGFLTATEGAPRHYDFADVSDRRLVSSVIAPDRRRALHVAVSARRGPEDAQPGQRTPGVEREPRTILPRRFRFTPRSVAAAAGTMLAILVLPNWIARVARANNLELAPGSTILLADVRDETGDSVLAQALGTAAAVGLQQSRHVALVHAPRARPRGGAGARPVQRRLDVEAARDIALRDSVARVVSLGVERADSAYRLAARVIDPRSGEVLGEEQVEVGRTGLVDGLDGLLKRVRERLGESQSAVRDSSRPLRAVASPSLEALDAYTQGARAQAAGDAAAARGAWMRALALDSSFALAELALAHDAFGRGADADGDHWLERAIAHANRLTTVEALRARQLTAVRSGELADASTLALELIRLEPSREAWYALADARFRAGSCADAGNAIANALALDSLHAPSHRLAAHCALQAGDVAAALAHHAAVLRADSTIVTRPAYNLEWGMALVRGGRLLDADAAFRRALAGGTAADTLQATRLLAALEMLRGRYAAAIPHLQQIAQAYRTGSDPAALRLALLAEAEAFVAIGGRTRASELLDEVLGLAGAGEAAPVEYFHAGHLLTRIGRLNGAREVLRLLAMRVVAGETESAWAERLLDAFIRLSEREGGAAMAAIGADPAPASLEPFRLAAASEAALLSGQYEKAQASARRLADGWYFASSAQDEWMRALLRLARIAEARGDTAAAIRSYQRYVDRWRDADVYLTELAAVRRSLARLGGGTVTASR